MRKIEIYTLAIAVMTATPPPVWPDDLAAIRQALQARYELTKTTADKSDIVKAGAIVVLKKGNLVTVEVTSRNFYKNTYKNGRISQSLPPLVGNRIQQAHRTFVSGEKLWVTGVDAEEKEIIVTLYSEAIDNVRYAAPLRFPIERGSTPTVSEVMAGLGEVFDIQASGDHAPAQPSAIETINPPQPTPAVEALPIPPPPPGEPAETPKTVSAGQTPDQVIARLGQPREIADLGAKQMYLYTNLKVTFVDGKVATIQ